MPVPTVPEVATNVIRLARAAGCQEDDDIGRLLDGIAQLSLSLDTKMDALTAKLGTPDISKQIRVEMLHAPQWKALQALRGCNGGNGSGLLFKRLWWWFVRC